MLRGITVRAVLEFLPAAKVSSRAMKQVAVTGWQQLAHQHHECIDPHHDQMLTWPAHIIVLGALWIESTGLETDKLMLGQLYAERHVERHTNVRNQSTFLSFA